MASTTVLVVLYGLISSNPAVGLVPDMVHYNTVTECQANVTEVVNEYNLKYNTGVTGLCVEVK